MNKRAVVKALSATGIAYGASALLAPARLQSWYGTPTTTPELRSMTRLWGTALLTIAATAARARDEDLDGLLLVVGLGNLTDAAGSVYAGLRDGVPAKAAALGAATSAAVAAGCFYGRSLD
jgi:hypothetical protein